MGEATAEGLGYGVEAASDAAGKAVGDAVDSVAGKIGDAAESTLHISKSLKFPPPVDFEQIRN